MYALIDACSADDLQHLHTIFGGKQSRFHVGSRELLRTFCFVWLTTFFPLNSFAEGPCRSTLATLQHDYKLNFQYGGKV